MLVGFSNETADYDVTANHSIDVAEFSIVNASRLCSSGTGECHAGIPGCVQIFPSATALMFDAALDVLPARLHERVTCSIVAAVKYDIPADVILAVAETEGGKPGQWVKNSNATYDVGAMQFNTSYLKELARFGITAQDVENPGCYPYDLAAWRLFRHLSLDHGDVWQRAANYHSKTPKYNAIYRAKLVKSGAKWNQWLSRHYQTRIVATP